MQKKRIYSGKIFNYNSKMYCKSRMHTDFYVYINKGLLDKHSGRNASNTTKFILPSFQKLGILGELGHRCL